MAVLCRYERHPRGDLARTRGRLDLHEALSPRLEGSSPLSTTRESVDELDPKHTSSRTLTPRGQRTRRALLDAGRRVFEANGYHHTHIADVAAEAGYAVGSFYTYFDSKEDLFRELLIELEDEVYSEPTRLSVDAPPRERLRETNRLYFESFRRNSAFYVAVEEATIHSEEARHLLSARHRYYHERTRRALSHWQAKGAIPAHVNLQFAAFALGSMTERCAYMWFALDEPVDFDAAVEEITRIWVKALELDDSAG